MAARAGSVKRAAQTGLARRRAGAAKSLRPKGARWAAF